METRSLYTEEVMTNTLQHLVWNQEENKHQIRQEVKLTNHQAREKQN